MAKEELRSSRQEQESYTYVCSECGYKVKVDATFVIHETCDRVNVTAEVNCDECGNMMER